MILYNKQASHSHISLSQQNTEYKCIGVRYILLHAERCTGVYIERERIGTWTLEHGNEG